MPRIVFFGSSESVFSNLHFRALLDTGCHVVAAVDVPAARRVSTNASRPQGPTFVQMALERRIPALEPADPNAPAVISALQELRPDAFMAVGYMLLLKGPLLAVAAVTAANFHASLLPAYRGKHPVFWALRAGERWSGITVHQMSRGLDTGDIIFQLRVRTRSSDSVSSLYDRINTRSLSLVPRLVDCIARGAVPRRPQSGRGASTCRATTDSDFRLDWSLPSEVLARWIAATPGQCYIPVAGGRVFLLGGQGTRRRSAGPPGTVISLRGSECVIATGRGTLSLGQARTADGRIASARDALSERGVTEGFELRATNGEG